MLVHLGVNPRGDDDAVERSAVVCAPLAVDPLAGGELVGGEHPGELDLVLHAAVLVEVPVEEVLVVDHGGDEGDHEPASAPSLVVPVAVLHVLPQHAHVLLVHADRLLGDVRRTLRVAEHRIEVADVTEAVAPELQRIGAVSEAVIADVERALALKRRVRVGVRNRHLHQAGPLHDRPALERRVVNHQALAVVETQSHGPPVPGDDAVVRDDKVGPVGLRHVERLHRVSVYGGQVGVGLQRGAVIVDVRLEPDLRGRRAGLSGAVDDLPGVEIHHR